MFRNRVKNKLRKVAIKAFGMEFDTEARDPNAGGKVDPSTYDPSVIPKLVDGDGDTPGPNHKEDIGRTWVAAQLAGGVAPLFVDIRSPQEMAAGVLPGALRFPAETILDHVDKLPAKTERVTIYDQTGAQGSIDVAAQLREQGWGWARRLRGGYAEWIEHGEPTETPSTSGASEEAVGDTTAIEGKEGSIVDVTADGTVWVWTSDSTLIQSN
ncbi:MAG: rhodanese-like domain-containing protein [Myxococcota bacterium]